MQVLQNPARQFDGNYGPVARGTAPPIAAASPRTHQQQQMTPAMRGGMGGPIRGAVPMGRGIAIPPPGDLNASRGGGGMRGRGGQAARGGPRGGMGRGGSEGAVPVARG